ncbi:MAG: YMGG-like glycine zipper-containing protein [Rickettsiales bacterium]
MQKIKNILLLVTSVSLVSACGSTQGERALSGAGIGAGVGAVGGAIAGANPIAGAVVGGAVGAAVGAVVDKSQVNLGKPSWK